MDKVELGRRIAEARELAGMSQADLGAAVDLDRSAVSRLEKGERKLSVPEIVAIADAVQRPLAFFVTDPVPAVVSRRQDRAHAHATTRALDAELHQFAADVRVLLAMELLDGVERTMHLPRTHQEAERAAKSYRDLLELGTGPITDLGATCERLGLYTLAVPLGPDQADGACVEVEHESAAVGAAVINGDAPAGRRRMTLAHELGHWLFGDAYDAKASLDSEQMINSFAIHFLAPRVGVSNVWQEDTSLPLRDRALVIGARYRLSWSATIGQLRNLGLVSYDEFRSLTDREPVRGDYLHLGLRWTEDLLQPYLSPRFTAAVMDAYVDRRLTAERAVELTRGMLGVEDLPSQVTTIDHLRPSFAGHDDQ